jgi:hypothetical protein
MMNKAKQRRLENIEDLKKEVHRDWYEDGIFEICFGMLYLIVGLVFVSPNMKFLHGSHLSIVFLRLIVLLAILGGTFWLIRKLKEKVVWSRLGYSARTDYNFKMVLILTVVIFLFFGFYILDLSFLSSGISTFLLGFIMFFVFVAQYVQAGKSIRFLVLSPIPLLIAGINYLLGLTPDDGLFLMIYILGCTFLISGVIVYVNFKRQLT